MITLLAKVWFDLWGNKSRTLQVVLVIALGSIAIGLVVGGRNVIQAAIDDAYINADPAHIRLALTPSITAEQLDRIGNVDGVWQVEGLYSGGVEWRLSDSDDWQSARIKAREGYSPDEMLMGPDGLREGTLPGRNSLGIGVISVGEAQLFVGDTVQIRFGDKVTTYPIVALMDPVGPEPSFGETFYADKKTYGRITGREDYQIVQLRSETWDPARAEIIDQEIQDYFDGINVDSVGTAFPGQERIIPPDVNPATGILNALFLILGIIGVVVVILGIFLVYNSISAIVSQQTSLIGVMKAIGASQWQVAWSYFILVISYGLLAMIISLPLGILSAYGLQTFFANFLNLETNEIAIDTTAVIIQILICVIAPLLAAAIPLWTGMTISVREAISTYGLAGAMGLVNRLVAGFKNLSYAIVLTIGNTFRNQKRVLIIQVALVVAGTIFMMVLGVSQSNQYTADGKLREVHPWHIVFSTDQPERMALLERTALTDNRVVDTESWYVTGGSARPIDQAEKEVTDARVSIIGQSADTDLYKTEIVEGRWLNETDTYSIVAGTIVAAERGWNIGDQVILTNGADEEMTVTLVGTHFDPAGGTNTLLMPLNTLQTEWAGFEISNLVVMQLDEASAANQEAVVTELEENFLSIGVGIRPASPFGANTIDEISANLAEGLSIIIQLLAVMAVVIALVGGVGLSGVLSLSVLERTREIGVMRAIGASSGQVIRLFIGEGILLGWLSWVIAIPLSIPAAWYLSTRGLSFVLNSTLAYQFSFMGPLIWLAIITVLAILASIFPARRASRVSVRESLSYS
ncbi:MAG: FtsX-like permease family protein [Chloroflexota bacterium]